jgi:hypothetical protein
MVKSLSHRKEFFEKSPKTLTSKSLKLRWLSLALSISFVANSLSPGYADNLDVTQPFKPKSISPIELKRKEVIPQDLFPKMDLPLSFPPPIPLFGVQIRGLNAEGINRLGQNYFVVVTNTNYSNMNSVYQDNHLHGKSNFVTADSLIHPYFAFTNRIIAQMVKDHLAPDLLTLLKSMLTVSLADLKQATDLEVRDDIEHNTALLLLSIRLLEPQFVLPISDKSANSSASRLEAMAQADLQSIESAKTTKSAIFDREIDFSIYKPIGWYTTEPKLAQFFKLRQWLSSVSLPVTDVTYDIHGATGNNFRRSVLLYRSLDQARINGQPVFPLYDKICRAWKTLAPEVQYDLGKALLPNDYKSVFSSLTQDLKVTLTNLAQPFYRTKLLLSIRRQKPLNLGSASIFELGQENAQEATSVSFHLLPAIGEPEIIWLRQIAKYYPGNEAEAAISWPLALYFLHARTAGQANNVLNALGAHLDPQIINVLPELERLAQTPTLVQVVQNAADRRWRILETYFTSYPDTVQTALKTDNWYTHRLESAIGGWADSLMALAFPVYSLRQANATMNAHANSAANSPTPTALENKQASKPVFYHYLEPQIATYGRIHEDGEKLLADYTALGYFPDEYRERLNDFIRLSQRLEKIAIFELSSRPLAMSDVQLLANIESIFEKVTLPLPNTLHVYFPQKAGRQNPEDNGFNFGLGYAGCACVILQHDFKTNLGRGPVYTYYELPGKAITPEHWLRKLQFGLVRTPPWAQNFDCAQEPESKTQATKVKPRD